jgi:hypothetical protein
MGKAMRNKFAGKCYMCKFEVAPGEGHFEKVNDRWATIHAECVFVLREAKQKCWEIQSKKTKELKVAL